MTAQDYFAARPIAISPRARQTVEPQATERRRHERNSSTDTTASAHIFLRPCCYDLGTSPSQRAVSFSSWTHYKNERVLTPAGTLKASLLCEARGLSSSYDPPAHEWIFLGADQPQPATAPWVDRNIRQRKKKFESSSTLSSMTLASDGDDAALFAKRRVTRVSTSSQLTTSIKGSSSWLGSIQKSGMAAADKRLGLEGMTCEDLPSAFDSDDEDEEGG